MDEPNRKFNGYLFIDPRIEVGDRVVLDDEDEVIVMEMGNIFARVRHEDMEWSVMLNRLSAYDE